MSDLGKVWKQTAKSFIIAASDLGVSLYTTVKAGVDFAVDWAKKDNPHVQTEATEVADEPVPDAEEAKAEAEAEENKKEE